MGELSQKVWRNAEGREFPLASEADVFQDALVGDRLVPKDVMQAFGYELVDASSEESATQAGSPSGGTSLADGLAEFCYELAGQLADADAGGARANWRHILYDAICPVLREAKCEAWDECADKLRSWENEREADELIEANPYGPEPPKGESGSALFVQDGEWVYRDENGDIKKAERGWHGTHGTVPE